MIYYSFMTGGFYDDSINSVIPTDALEIDRDEHGALMQGLSHGMLIKKINGKAKLIEKPKPDKQELNDNYRIERQVRINSANNFINDKQWPSRLALGRLDQKEKDKFNLWLDYLEALDNLNVDEIMEKSEWPEKPNE